MIRKLCDRASLYHKCLKSIKSISSIVYESVNKSRTKHELDVLLTFFHIIYHKTESIYHSALNLLTLPLQSTPYRRISPWKTLPIRPIPSRKLFEQTARNLAKEKPNSARALEQVFQFDFASRPESPRRHMRSHCRALVGFAESFFESCSVTLDWRANIREQGRASLTKLVL